MGDFRNILRTKRQKDSLQHFRESFYEDVAEFVVEQRVKREQKAGRPGTYYSPETQRLADEIKATEEVVTSIYERHVGKVVKVVNFATTGMTSETDRLIREEKRLFDDLVACIEENCGTVLSALEDVSTTDSPWRDVAVTDATTAEPDTPGDSGLTIPPDKPDPEIVPIGPGTDASALEAVTGDLTTGDVLADAMGGGIGGDASDAQSTPQSDADRPATEIAAVFGESRSSGFDVASSGSADSEPVIPPDGPDPETAVPSAGDTDTVEPSADDSLSGLADEHETMRITTDVRIILGVDEREYDLAIKDVMTPPMANADPLVEHGAAKRLD